MNLTPWYTCTVFIALMSRIHNHILDISLCVRCVFGHMPIHTEGYFTTPTFVLKIVQEAHW
mgnify:CR=1 FL=1